MQLGTAYLNLMYVLQSLFDLYYSYQLALELERILKEADDQLRKVGNQLDDMQEEGASALDQSDIFKFDIFKAEFEVQREEVRQSINTVQRIWAYILDPSQQAVYEPESLFLDAVPFELELHRGVKQLEPVHSSWLRSPTRS
jgi:uncharacterized membrane protein YccC